jgi:hypothetical protein
VAEEHEHGGTVIRGDDGAIYFIRPEILEMTKVTEPEMQAFCASLIDEHQSEVEGFALGSGVASLAFVGPFQAANYGFDAGRAASNTLMCPGSMSLKAGFTVNPAFRGL